MRTFQTAVHLDLKIFIAKFRQRFFEFFVGGTKTIENYKTMLIVAYFLAFMEMKS